MADTHRPPHGYCVSASPVSKPHNDLTPTTFSPLFPEKHTYIHARLRNEKLATKITFSYRTFFCTNPKNKKTPHETTPHHTRPHHYPHYHPPPPPGLTRVVKQNQPNQPVFRRQGTNMFCQEIATKPKRRASHVCCTGINRPRRRDTARSQSLCAELPRHPPARERPRDS